MVKHIRGLYGEDNDIEWQRHEDCLCLLSADMSSVNVSRCPLVRHTHVIQITATGKNGEMAAVPWYLVRWSNGTSEEVNGKYVMSISYSQEMAVIHDD